MRMSRGFSMDTLRPHEYDIPLDRGGHLEGPHVFGFLINAFLRKPPKTPKKHLLTKLPVINKICTLMQSFLLSLQFLY